MTEFNVRDQLTLLELAKRTNLGSLVTIVEVLDKTNEWLQDAIWLPANQSMSHITTQRTSLPSGTWRKLNQGVAPEASSTKQIVEGIGVLEAYSRVDKLLVQLSSNPEQFRSNEDLAFVEGLGQELSKVMFEGAITTGTTAANPYGCTDAHPERFNGLPRRLDAAGVTGVRDHGDSNTDDTSIYIVQWGPNRVHMIYPKGDPTMGVQHENLGEQTIEASGTYAAPQLMQAMVSHFKLNAGLVVRDDRCIRRIASIDSVEGTTYSFNAEATNKKYGHKDLIKELNALPYQGEGARIYCNNTIKSQMDILAVDKSNVLYNIENWAGRPITTFRGVPVRRVDAITDTETAL